VQENVALLVEQQQRAGAVPALAVPAYGQPGRPDNRMCLPTAAGVAITCF
jgi:hypothetical protein